MQSLDARLSWVPERLTALLAQHEIPGAAVAILHDGEVSETAAGLANLATGVEATPDTLFLIGSITKVYTTTLIMQLVDQGKVELDAPVRTYLPSLRLGTPELTEGVTVRHLLSHTSGIPGDYMDDFGRGDDAVRRYVESLAELGQLHPPGAMFSYSNSGFILAGRLVEELTGQTWHAALRRNLLEPSGLRQTVTLPEDALPFRVGVGHVPDPERGGLRVGQMWPEFHAGAPAGFTPFASARDVLRFAELHLRGGQAADGTRVLSQSSVAAMQAVQANTVDNRTFDAEGRGLGWARYRYGSEPVLGHNGGASATLRVLPERRFAVAMLTNAAGGVHVAHHLIDEVVDDLFGLRIPTAPEGDWSPDADELAPYAGVYRHVSFTVEVRVHNDELLLVHPEDTETGKPESTLGLRPLAPGTFASRSPDYVPPMQVSFLEFGPDGRPAYLHFGGRAYPRIA